jgi:peptide/nickel transport system permease protein
MGVSVEAGPDAPVARRAAGWRYLWYRLRRSPIACAGLAIIATVLLVALLAPVLAPYDPDRLDLAHRLAPPSAAHPFGADEVGRDLLSRVIWGGRVSITVGLAVVAISMSIGTLVGAFAGLAGGRADTAIMRLMDVLISFPSFVMALALAAALGPDLINAMFAIAIVRVPFYVRLARSQALVLRELPYVKAAVTFGSSRLQIVQLHILPNGAAPVIVQGTLDIGSAILTTAALGFIGLGAQQPTAEWGAMISNGRDYFLDEWWYPTFPGLAILVTAIGFNFLGDGLRDIFDPRLRGR